MSEYLAPTDLNEALEMAAAGARTIVAGGTDFYPARVGVPLTEAVVDISGIGELRGIERQDRAYRIGALTSWSDIANADLPRCFDALRSSARQVGGVQVQNAATIGGNLCNASPAADGVPPLLALDASVELSSNEGTRVLPLDLFITGYRQTALRQGELLAAVLVPRDVENAASDFRKLGSRRYLVISIVMVAALIATDPANRVTAARVAIGSCSPVARRMRSLEADLIGRSIDDDLGGDVNADHLAELSPIDDVRASADYRRQAALVLVRRALRACGGSL